LLFRGADASAAVGFIVGGVSFAQVKSWVLSDNCDFECTLTLLRRWGSSP
jgi:hypothetical protein